MPIYRYKARDKSGMPITGVTEAENKKVLAFGLKELGYQVVSVEQEKGVKILLNRFTERFKRIKKQDVVLFYRQMGVMLKSGLPLMVALSSIGQQVRNPKFKAIIIEITEDIKAGKSLSDAMQKYPDLFSGFAIGMVKAGEAGGIMPDTLGRLAVIGMEEMELRGKVLSATTYPIILVCVAIVIVTFLLVGILPKFVAIFEESGAKLPIPTIILLTISNAMQRFWYLGLALIIGPIVFLRFYTKSLRGKYKFHGFLLKIPLFGDITLKLIVTRFCRTLGSLTKSGVPLLYALEIVHGLVKNTVVAKALENIKGAITKGEKVSEPFRLSGVFPPIVTQMISAGEKTGTLDSMFLSISDYYEQEVDYSIRTMTALLEPLLLLAMGLIVGFIAISVLLPIFNLIRVFKT